MSDERETPWHPVTGVNPPFNDGKERPMSMGELYQYHERAGTLSAFFELYPGMKPRGDRGR